jgi:hypothetical protein
VLDGLKTHLRPAVAPVGVVGVTPPCNPIRNNSVASSAETGSPTLPLASIGPFV